MRQRLAVAAYVLLVSGLVLALSVYGDPHP